MANEWTRRAQWHEIPEHVRAGIEQLLGSPVRTAVNQIGGMSPGFAARIRCADGSRAFVKAVGSALNPDSPDIYRREGRTAAALPRTAPVPALRGRYDDGDWVALVFDEIDGRMPELPWRRAEVIRVADALAELSASLTPCPIMDVAGASTELESTFGGYARMAADPPSDLDPWERRHLDALAELSKRTLAHLDGDTLVHFDIRADNVLLGSDQRVYFVDWPWAFRGAAWLDTVLFLINPALDGHDPEGFLPRSGVLAYVDAWRVTGLLAGIAGFFSEGCRQPDPPGLPTLRAFQRAQLDVVLAWLQRRTAWP